VPAIRVGTRAQPVVGSLDQARGCALDGVPKPPEVERLAEKDLDAEVPEFAHLGAPAGVDPARRDEGNVSHALHLAQDARERDSVHRAGEADVENHQIESLRLVRQTRQRRERVLGPADPKPQHAQHADGYVGGAVIVFDEQRPKRGRGGRHPSRLREL